MKFLVYGAKGWMGSQFVQYMKDSRPWIEVVEGKARIDNRNDLDNEVATSFPSCIINFAARTHGIYQGEVINNIDYLEKPGKLTDNIRDNYYGAVNISAISNYRGIHAVHISSSAIFNYDDDHPFEDETKGFTESDVPNYTGSSFAIVKGYSDLSSTRFRNILNIRIGLPIDSLINDRNLITKLTRYYSQTICSVKNSFTILPDFFPYLYKLTKIRFTGTLNFVNPGAMNHNEILDMYKEIVDPTFTWTNVTQEQLAQITLAGRSNCCLDTKYLLETIPQFRRYTLPDIRTSLRAVLIKYKYNLENPTPVPTNDNNTNSNTNTDSNTDSNTNTNSNTNTDSNTDSNTNQG